MERKEIKTKRKKTVPMKCCSIFYPKLINIVYDFMLLVRDRPVQEEDYYYLANLKGVLSVSISVCRTEWKVLNAPKEEEQKIGNYFSSRNAIYGIICFWLWRLFQRIFIEVGLVNRFFL